jgi:hypothetical protein
MRYSTVSHVDSFIPIASVSFINRSATTWLCCTVRYASWPVISSFWARASQRTHTPYYNNRFFELTEDTFLKLYRVHDKPGVTALATMAASMWLTCSLNKWHQEKEGTMD